MLSLNERSKLTILYEEQYRFYHTIKHINHCLSELEDFVDNNELMLTLGDIKKLTYAIWYHDAIYNSYSKKNEENSARLFFEESFQNFKNALEVDEICKLILCTKNHKKIDDKNVLLQNLICDIDLSIFGRTWLEYKQYYIGIITEYSNVPVEQINFYRTKMIQDFMNETRIYKTDYFNKKYEVTARKNLQSELDGKLFKQNI